MWLKYSNAPIMNDEFWERQQAKYQFCYQKPIGCWITDDSDCCWKTWCIGNDFGLDRLTHKHEVILDDSNVLILESAEDIDNFGREWSCTKSGKWMDRYILWDQVAKKYDGLIITPYQWSRRMERSSSWYYGWDCAGGCIWKPSAIKEVRLISISKEEKTND